VPVFGLFHSPRMGTAFGRVPRPMSALGHKRTHAAQQSPPLFDHVVGGDEQAGRRSQTESFGRCEIKGGLVLRRSLYR
jgi:hypothetical protein